ncbi:MAG TPA: SWIM zinc finger family protein [Pyrinomonadaceae bacterium]|jgi:hypothetical protein
MAGEKNLLDKLVNQARSLDDDALAALSNKGLVRRARKDFSSLETLVALVSGDENTVKIQAADATVTLTDNGLTQAVCDCPSVEVCRHVLIACFWLAEQKAENAEESAGTTETGEKSEEPSFQNLLDVSLPDFEKSLGKKVFAQGIDFLQKNSDCQFTAPSSGVILVEFVEANISVRLLKDADFGGHLCSCRKQEICLHKVAAVLAFRRENNVEYLPKTSPDKTQLALKLSPSQIKVLKQTQKLFEEFVEIGCAHLSESSVEQLQTLATSAGGASVFRLSFALKSLADGLNLSLQRSAQADETAWLIFLAKTYALVSSLLLAETPNPKLIGVSRSSYEGIGTLELAGVGAYQWQTLSGYHGITILFWDNRAKRFFLWTDARPKANASFNPAAAFTGEMRWQGFNSPKQAAESVFKLQNAARNSQNRLSGSGEINGFVTGATEIEKLDFASIAFSDWQELRHYFAGVFPYGLRERETFKEFVVVRPKQFGERFFDEAKQNFVWQICDESENIIRIKLTYNTYNEPAIQILEKLNPSKDKVIGILARLSLDEGGLYLHPISIFLKPKSGFLSGLFNRNTNDFIQIIHLNLTVKVDKKANIENKSEKVAVVESEMDENIYFEILETEGGIPQKISKSRQILQNFAESGTSSISNNLFEILAQESETLDSTGLSKLANSISAFIKSPRTELPKNLLKLIFLFELSSEIAQTRSRNK